MFSLLALGYSPALGMVAVIQVLRRATAFSITVPAASVLYTVVTPEEKYKTKHFIDTVVYRAGDVMNGWTFTVLRATGMGLSGIAVFGALLASVWVTVALAVGRQFQTH